MVHRLLKGLPNWLKSFYVASNETHLLKETNGISEMVLSEKYRSLRDQKYKSFCNRISEVVTQCIYEWINSNQKGGQAFLDNIKNNLGVSVKKNGSLSIPNAKVLVKILEKDNLLANKVMYKMISDRQIGAYLRSPLKDYVIEDSGSGDNFLSSAIAKYEHDTNDFEKFLIDMPLFLSKAKTSSSTLKDISESISTRLGDFQDKRPDKDCLLRNKLEQKNTTLGGCHFYSSGEIAIGHDSYGYYQPNFDKFFKEALVVNRGKSFAFPGTVFSKDENLGHDLAFHVSVDTNGRVDKLSFVNSNPSPYPYSLHEYIMPMLGAISRNNGLSPKLKKAYNNLLIESKGQTKDKFDIPKSLLEDFKKHHAPEVSKIMKVQSGKGDGHCIRHAFYNSTTMAMLSDPNTGKLPLDENGELTLEAQMDLMQIRPTSDKLRNFLLQGIFDFSRKRDSALEGYNDYISRNAEVIRSAIGPQSKGKKSKELNKRMQETMAKIYNSSISAKYPTTKKLIEYANVSINVEEKDGQIEISTSISQIDPRMEEELKACLENVAKSMEEFTSKKSVSRTEAKLHFAELLEKSLSEVKNEIKSQKPLEKPNAIIPKKDSFYKKFLHSIKAKTIGAEIDNEPTKESENGSASKSVKSKNKKGSDQTDLKTPLLDNDASNQKEEGFFSRNFKKGKKNNPPKKENIIKPEEITKKIIEKGRGFHGFQKKESKSRKDAPRNRGIV